MLFPSASEPDIDPVEWEADARGAAFIYLSTTTRIVSGPHPPADIRVLINNQSGAGRASGGPAANESLMFPRLSGLETSHNRGQTPQQLQLTPRVGDQAAAAIWTHEKEPLT